MMKTGEKKEQEEERGRGDSSGEERIMGLKESKCCIVVGILLESAEFLPR